MKREERLRLNEMSKKAYGVSSKWQKMLRKPILSDEYDVMTKRKVKGTYWLSLEEIIEEMEFIIAEKEAEIKAKEEKSGLDLKS